MIIRLLSLLITVFICQITLGQSWHWAKKNLVIEGIQTSPQRTCIDSRGNTIVFSSKLDRKIISKHDTNGTMLWKRELFLVIPGSSQLAAICVDGFDNIYVVIGPISKIDTMTINSPSPYSIIKLNSTGRYMWAKEINYNPLIFAPTIVSHGDRLFLALSIREFQTLTYQSVVYTNPGGNTNCTFFASLDTAGNVQWTKRIWSPPMGLTCGTSDVYPNVSINDDKELFLVGDATDKVFIETTPVIDFPYNCKRYSYGMVINGNTGALTWANDLQLDTMVPVPNYTIMPRRPLSTILSNGYSAVYQYITLDTAIATSFHRIIAISNKVYLYDRNGNRIRKDSIGRRDTGWHEIYQMVPGKNAAFFSSGVYNGFTTGNIVEFKTYEARKWDTLFATTWKKNTVYSQNWPYFSSNHLFYRNNALNTILQSGSESHNGHYAYFGADSLLPHLDFLFARMIDSSNFISGTVYFDMNQNGNKDPNEPVAPNVLIGNMAGDSIYTVTRANGFYEMIKGPGTHNYQPINLNATYPGFTIVTPTSHSVTLTGYGNYILNKNFGLKPAAGVTDGQININTHSLARPGATMRYLVYVKNTGTTNFTGTYKIIYDTARLIYLTSQQAPTSTSPPQLNYSFGNVVPLGFVGNLVEFTVKTTAPINDTIKIKAELTTNPADALAINNADSVYTVIRGSFDPNMKEVYPFKDVIYDSVIVGHQELDYIIHFQNTGNDTAFAINILDTLDSKLNPSTFRLISSSHPVNITWTQPNIAGFYFPGILLPDSNRNEVKSHGFVRFKIKPKANVLLSDLVLNNASIYFDYNSPIRTNTVITNFVNSIITGVNNNSINVKGIRVRPNPASNNIYFKVIVGNINEKMALSVYDESGRLIIRTSRTITSNNEQLLDISRLSSGVYYLELKGKKHRFLKQLVVQ